MKNFDRILNVVLVIAVAFFIVDYFTQDTPATLDEKNNKFAPVELSAPAPNEATSSPELTAEEDAAITTTPPIAAVGGPEVAVPEAFKALTWEQLDAKVNDPNGKPTLIVLFTSWCPYCKKMMPVVSEMAATEKDRMNVLAISIDEDPAAIKGYMASMEPLPPFPVYLHSTDNERSLVQAYLYKNQLNFTGGIPYMAFFNEGKPVQQFGGFVERNVLTETLNRIEHPEKAL